MPTKEELTWMPAHRVRELIASKEVSSVEVTELALERIERLNPTLNAFLTVVPDMALEMARDAEAAVMRGDELGPLHGVPTSIKDLEGLAGVRQTDGSLIYKDRIADADALSTERLKAAGAVMLGKTNTPEYGHIGTNENRLGEPCRNPWNPECTSGASSGGAGASVAAGITAIAQGSDGGGSIRIPSAFNGIYGIKATQGRVPRRQGGLPSWNPINTSCVGPLTRDVRDAAIMLQAIAGPGPDAEDGTIQSEPPDFVAALERGVRGLRVAWSPDLGGVAVDPEVVRVTRAAAEVFAELGATVEEPGFRADDPEEVLTAFFSVFRSKAFAQNGWMLEKHPDLLTDYYRLGLERGRDLTATELHMGQARIMKYRAYVRDFFTRYDLLLTPTTAVPAFPVNGEPEVIGGKPVPDRRMGFTPFTYLFNMTGNPAATAPAGFSESGMPIGLHIVGRRNDEETVLAASAAFEAARPWADKRPAIAS
ncbi:MAG: amidase family protein [Dehalococcoidia bacterium]